MKTFYIVYVQIRLTTYSIRVIFNCTAMIRPPKFAQTRIQYVATQNHQSILFLLIKSAYKFMDTDVTTIFFKKICK